MREEIWNFCSTMRSSYERLWKLCALRDEDVRQRIHLHKICDSARRAHVAGQEERSRPT